MQGAAYPSRKEDFDLRLIVVLMQLNHPPRIFLQLALDAGGYVWKEQRNQIQQNGEQDGCNDRVDDEISHRNIVSAFSRVFSALIGGRPHTHKPNLRPHSSQTRQMQCGVKRI